MKYRFFYHFNKQKKRMTVHFKNQCMIVDNIICEPRCETKWNKRQPYLVMRGFCHNITIKDNTAVIN